MINLNFIVNFGIVVVWIINMFHEG